MAAKVRRSALARVFGYLWPQPMPILEASLSGTFRTVLVLVVIWWLLRLFMRWQMTKNGNATRPPRWTSDTRPPGEVTIERIKDPGQNPGTSAPDVTDADFEEIK